MIRVFNDKKSIIHTLAGFVGYLLGFSVEMTIIFSFYQLIEVIDIKENYLDTFSDFIEYLAGVFLAMLVVFYGSLVCLTR